MLLTIQHNGTVFTPLVEDGVQITWERTGSPGKLTFTVITQPNRNLVFTEGDPVCFYYDDKPVFLGYIFTKKYDKERKIQVTCYDQIRYLKNKFTYVFENKTATEIIQALCDDFGLKTKDDNGNSTLDDTEKTIPAIAEENKSALDIVLDALEETLVLTKKLFVFYDDFGTLRLSNSSNMVSTTLIYDGSAENFDFKSSIDDETYNQVVLHYKTQDGNGEDKKIIQQVYIAKSDKSIKQWGLLQYFDEVKNPSDAETKAKKLLELYNRKTRELKITGAFGDISVRGGTLIPIQLALGVDEPRIDNYMIVEKVTHNFSNDYHTMDLTLDKEWNNEWDDVNYNVHGNNICLACNREMGTRPVDPSYNNSSSPFYGDFSCPVCGQWYDELLENEGDSDTTPEPIYQTVTINQSNNDKTYCGKIRVQYIKDGKTTSSEYLDQKTTKFTFTCDSGTYFKIIILPYITYDEHTSSGGENRKYNFSFTGTNWSLFNDGVNNTVAYQRQMYDDAGVLITWSNDYTVIQGKY